MTLKIFYDKTTWRGFYPPREPNIKQPTWAFVNDMDDYEKAYAEAKANALEVGNPEFLEGMRKDRDIDLHPQYKAEIKDGKYILSL